MICAFVCDDGMGRREDDVFACEGRHSEFAWDLRDLCRCLDRGPRGQHAEHKWDDMMGRRTSLFGGDGDVVEIGLLGGLYGGRYEGKRQAKTRVKDGEMRCE